MSGVYEFEWEPRKSIENKRKHGISFEEAIEIWQGMYLEIKDIAYAKDGESCSACVGMVGGKAFTAIWTMRVGKIRLICVRRSRDEEKKAYVKALSER